MKSSWIVDDEKIFQDEHTEQISLPDPTPAEKSISLFKTADFSIKSPRKQIPERGARGLLYSTTRINLGKSAKEQHYDNNLSTINTALEHKKVILVMSAQNGVGKTSIAMLIASMFARERNIGQVLAMDTDYHGNLSKRGTGTRQGTVEEIAGLTKKQASCNLVYTYMQSAGKLHLLASRTDPEAKALSPITYQHVIDLINDHYNIVFVDTGGSRGSLLDDYQLSHADAIITVVCPSKDSADKTQNFLETIRHNYRHLVKKNLIVLNNIHPGKIYIDPSNIVDTFTGEYRLPVLEIPYDSHIAEAGVIDLKLISSATAWQAVRIGAKIMEIALRNDHD